MKKTIVSSWNEWDPLKHVIVGRADNCCIPAPEPAVDVKIPPDSVMKGNTVEELRIQLIKQMNFWINL